MSQSGRLTPNLDEKTTKVLNLPVLQRLDPSVEEILITAAHVTFYEFNIDDSQWSRKDVEGSLFVVKRNTQPRFQFIVMNRRNTGVDVYRRPSKRINPRTAVPIPLSPYPDISLACYSPARFSIFPNAPQLTCLDSSNVHSRWHRTQHCHQAREAIDFFQPGRCVVFTGYHTSCLAVCAQIGWNPPERLQRPYGAPLLQPFPPPTPPLSLTPASVPPLNYGPMVSREKVREALQVLVQDNQFIDMVYRALLNAHQS